ncbi:hypothetical protein CAEBREN_12669 [Caenorhabditis brenneri]|uniref:Uncharacterized protein n=1 Tax=Caenorhabditis brenneri TaxID=135651 RepID=G0MHA6_CAEBE|nr:hypothetical protein CAEBREN_12669 [Caenorhabditis brenneri]
MNGSDSTSTLKGILYEKGIPSTSIHYTSSSSQPDVNKVNIRFMSDEHSGTPTPVHEINNALIRFTSNGKCFSKPVTIPFINFRFSDMLEIKQKFQNEMSEIREQNVHLENENRELKSSISEAIDEIMTLKRDKEQFSNEVLKAYTANLAIVAENEQLKKEAANKETQYQKAIQTMNRSVSSNTKFQPQTDLDQFVFKKPSLIMLA